MKDFRKFESLENTYNKSSVSKIIYNGYDKSITEWIVTEKLHGCNFSIHISNGKVFFGSRNGFLTEFQEFYNSEAIRETLRNKILSKTLPFSDVIIYGELVGPHIQTEVTYTNKIKFFVFDVVVNGNPINKIDAQQLADHYGLDFVPVIKVGSFEECIEVKNTFNSLVLSMENNLAEGIIIEPVEPTYFNNGKRIYFKNKTRQFSEKNDGIVDTSIKELSDLDNLLLGKLLTYLNKNRLNAVKSKGHTDRAIPYMLTKDIFDDYVKDRNDELSSKGFEGIDLRKTCDNWAMVSKYLQMEVNKFIIGVGLWVII